MATGRMRFYSAALCGQVNFSFVLTDDFPPFIRQNNSYYNRPAKTLYLLHGYSGNDADWEYNGIAEDVAAKYNLNVIMVNGGNEFYLDRPASGRQYCTFTGKEIVDFTRKAFGLSDRREDTLIGGLSMGGFGALHTGLAWPDTFGGVIALSSALILHAIAGMKPGTIRQDIMANFDYYHEVFGDLDHVLASDANPEVLYDRLAREGHVIPSIYMAIGTEDFLYNDNQTFRRFLEERHADLKYEEGPGVHDWKFWNQYIGNGVEWLLKRMGD